MAFHHLTKAAVEKCIGNLKGPLSVCDFGNQRYAGGWDPQKYKTTADYYKQEHGAQYIAFDLNSEMGAIPLDLNRPVAEQNHLQQYDLVVNNGTSEHLFNQYQVFKNMHDLCILGGIMLNIVPFSPWINHGFFNYNPIFFRDLMLANDYKHGFIWICDRYNDGWKELNNAQLFDEKDPSYLMGKIAKANRLREFSEMGLIIPEGHHTKETTSLRFNQLFIAAAYRKVEHQSFCPPIQGKYKQAIDDKEIGERYGVPASARV